MMIAMISRVVTPSCRCVPKGHLSLMRLFSVASTSTSHDEQQQDDDAPSAGAIARIQERYRADPKAALGSFSSTSSLTKGLRSSANIRDKFQLQFDEPTYLGGTDTGPNPVEMLLASLGACQEITWKAYARATETPLTSVSVQLQGDIDFRGFFAVSEEARAGFYQIHGTVTVTSTAPTEAIEHLKTVVDGHCPVKDMLNVPCNIELVHVQP